MKKLVVILTLIAASSVTLADTISHSLRYTKDDPDTTLHRNMITWVKEDYGVGSVNSTYRFPGNQSTSTGLVLVANSNQSDYSIKGYLGIGQNQARNYLLGDITYTRKVNDTFYVDFNVFGDLVDSPKSLQNNVRMQGVSLGGDYFTNDYGVAFGSRLIHYSDGNQRTGVYIKPYVSLIDGLNMYLSERYYVNSKPNNGVYYSPEYQNKLGYGVNFRYRWGVALVTGYVERGIQRTPENKIPFNLLKLEVVYPLSKNSNLRVVAGKDYSNNNFGYKYVETGIDFKF